MQGPIGFQTFGAFVPIISTLQFCFTSDQHVTFSFIDNNKLLAISAVYASTDHIRTRELWDALYQNYHNLNLPWSCIGDFNAIIGSHEHSGFHSPAKAPMEEFYNWTNSNKFLHIPTKVSMLTWTNGRTGNHLIEIRLDRTICNNQWISTCSSFYCSTLTKLRSNHHPFLWDFQTQEIRYASNFKFLKMWASHKDCHKLIETVWNTPIY